MPDSLPPAAIAYAQQMFDHARKGNLDALLPALQAGLPVNLTNSNGDTLVRLFHRAKFPTLIEFLPISSCSPLTSVDSTL